MLIVLTAMPTDEEAEKLAEQIIDLRLAACVQILPRMKSVYYWEGKIQKEYEHLLLIKTLETKYSELEKFITENHSYDTPEIVAIPIEHGLDKYSNWLSMVLGVKPDLQ